MRQVAPQALTGVSHVFHLAGAGIADRLWTKARKKEIWDSRVVGTRLLVDAAKSAGVRTIVSASGVGFYGDRGDELLDEHSSRGNGFLADLAEAWEYEALRAQDFGIRVVVFRFGVVISQSGGLLGKLLPIFRWGLGGRLGSGEQYMSWIALPDVVRAFNFALNTVELRGVYNLVAPNPVTNECFTANLLQYVKRPRFFPVPAWGIKVFLGEMGRELMLGSQRACSAKLVDSGFDFQFPEMQEALSSGV
jgi:uncharacterized protein (TIGR01777 family)